MYLNPKGAEMEMDFINGESRRPRLKKKKWATDIPRALVKDLSNMVLKWDTKQILVVAHNSKRKG
jgi:hypothetical protein